MEQHVENFQFLGNQTEQVNQTKHIYKTTISIIVLVIRVIAAIMALPIIFLFLTSTGDPEDIFFLDYALANALFLFFLSVFCIFLLRSNDILLFIVYQILLLIAILSNLVTSGLYYYELRFFFSSITSEPVVVTIGILVFIIGLIPIFLALLCFVLIIRIQVYKSFLR
jgi:hypothetical protein